LSSLFRNSECHLFDEYASLLGGDADTGDIGSDWCPWKQLAKHCWCWDGGVWFLVRNGFVDGQSTSWYKEAIIEGTRLVSVELDLVLSISACASFCAGQWCFNFSH